MTFDKHNTKPATMDWFEYIQESLNMKPIKEYKSKPLTDVEIKKVYRNDFFRQDSNAYFDYKDKPSRKQRIAEEYKNLKEEGYFNEELSGNA